jgi:hypothetical protein
MQSLQDPTNLQKGSWCLQALPVVVGLLTSPNIEPFIPGLMHQMTSFGSAPALDLVRAD